MIKKFLLLTLSSLLICSCSSANIDSNDDSTNPANNDSGYVEPPKEDPYPISNEKLNEITNAFYQQSFVEKDIDDDSSFCCYYEPRLININSFLPLYNYGIYDSTYVITFAINGFYGRADSYYSIEINDGKLSFPQLERYSYGMAINDYLIPQVYKDGKIYNIIEAYNNKIVGNEVFTTYTDYWGNEGMTLSQKGFQINQFSKEYFNNLPPLKKDKNTTYSYLIPEFEEIKRLFYQQEIVAKGYTDDSHFREHFQEEKYKTAKPIDEYSVHLNEYYDVTDSVRVYAVSVNDIYMEVQSYFGDITGRIFYFGDRMISTSYQIEPIIIISNRLYFITEAYNLGLFTDELMEAFNETFPYSNIPDRYPFSHQLEYKYAEREFYYQ